MATRVALVAAAILLIVLAIRRPAPGPAFAVATVAPSAAAPPAASRHGRAQPGAQSGLVYVAGAVRRPGLYPVRAGERIADVIARAGGGDGRAQAGAVNLAARVQDGDEVYVPAAGEGPLPRSSTRTRAGYRGAGSRHRRSSTIALPAGTTFDINTSDARSLQRVPGIGPAIASRIVALRELDGPYANLDELLDVAGMTQTRLERARDFLRAP